MNEAEKRRQELLREARALYQEQDALPAVHPRYRTAYNSLYETDTEYAHGTFKIRCVICLLLLAAYITADVRQVRLWNTGSEEIAGQIRQSAAFADTLTELFP